MTHDEDTLQEQLTEDLGRFEPGFAPVEAVISHGKAIKARRRALVASGLAVAAVLGVSASIGLGVDRTAEPAPGDGPHHVTVDDPRTDAQGNTVFSGSVDGKSWQASPETSGGMKGCVMGFGVCLDGHPAPADPISLPGSSDDATVNYDVEFRSDANLAVFDLADSERLAVRPSTLGYALFKLPKHLHIVRITAYAGSRELGFSIPFNGSGDLSVVAGWYAPGATARQVSASGRVAGGTATDLGILNGPVKWSVTAYEGAFGTCLVQEEGSTGSGATDCMIIDKPPSASVRFFRSGSAGTGIIIATPIAEGVALVDVAFASGTVLHVTPVHVGAHSFVAFLVPKGEQLSSTTSFDASGKQLAHETGEVPTKP